MKLYLVRHGDTELGPDGLYPEDGGLTELGHRQAAATAAALRATGITQIVTSALRRSRETASPLAEMTGLRPVAVAGLDEVRIGRLRDAPIETIARRIYGTSPKADFSEFGGENAAEFNERILYSLSRDIVDRYDGPDAAVAAFVHGGTISVILDSAQGVRFDGELRREIPNGSISLARVSNRRLEIDYVADAAHLEGVGITQMHGIRAPRPERSRSHVNGLRPDAARL